MTSLEGLFFFLEVWRNLGFMLFITFFCFTVFCFVVCVVDQIPIDEWPVKTHFGGLIFLATISCLPSVEDYTRVRIELLKFQLARPENVEKGEQFLERVSRELECKYLRRCK